MNMKALWADLEYMFYNNDIITHLSAEQTPK